MLWGYLQSKVYAGKPDTEGILKEAIRTEMKKVFVVMIDRTIYRVTQKNVVEIKII